MKHTISSETNYWALSILKTSLWVAGKNASLFLILLVVLSVLTIFLETSIGDLTQSLDADSIVEPFRNSMILLKYVFEVMLLKVALVHITIKTLNGETPRIRKMFNRVRGFRFTANAIKVVAISLIFLTFGFVFVFLVIATIASGIETGNVFGSLEIPSYLT